MTDNGNETVDKYTVTDSGLVMVMSWLRALRAGHRTRLETPSDFRAAARFLLKRGVVAETAEAFAELGIPQMPADEFDEDGVTVALTAITPGLWLAPDHPEALALRHAAGDALADSIARSVRDGFRDHPPCECDEPDLVGPRDYCRNCCCLRPRASDR